MFRKISTISGSRNGHSPIFMWYAIKTFGLDGLKERAIKSLELAEYAIGRFKSIGIDAWRNESAITVVFPAPAALIRQKWQIATENGLSHIICMPGLRKELIDQFIDELEYANAAVGS